jgi:preprotein translocase subunit Sss1
MNEKMGKSALQMAVFVLLTSAALLFFQTPGTAEFVVTVLSLGVGIVFVGVVVFVMKRLSR